MLKRRSLILLLCVVILSVGVLSACGSANNNNNNQANNQANNNGGDTPAPSGDEEARIHMFINMPEYTDAFNALVAEYKNVKPNVTIELEIMQADYPTILKSKIGSGALPDIFASTSGGEIELYAEYSADLTDEPLAAVMDDAVRENMTFDGQVLGLAVKGNLFSMIYNKELFDEAGIAEPPKTLSELEDAIEKLEAIGVTPFTNAYKEWWVQKHIFQHFMNAATDDTEALAKQFIAGTTTFADHPALLKYFDFIDLTVEHGMPKPLERDLSAEISDFATGQAAMMTGQGAWVEEAILQIAPDMQIGVAGYPVSDDPAQAMVITGADQAWRINKDSEVLQETLDFVNWLYTSDYGKSWFSDVAQVIPPLKDVPYPDLQMTQAMESIVATEETGQLAIIHSLDSFHQRFGEVMQAYIGGINTQEEAIDEIQKAWIQLGGAN